LPFDFGADVVRTCAQKGYSRKASSIGNGGRPITSTLKGGNVAVDVILERGKNVECL
jgi:hypothetical protein